MMKEKLLNQKAYTTKSPLSRIKFLILKCFRNTHIQARLMVAFVILSIIPALIAGTFSYRMSIDAIKSKISTYSADLLSQIQQNVNRELERLEYDSVEIMFMPDVQDALIRYNELSEWDKMSLELRLRERLTNKFSFLHDVSDVILYTNDFNKIVAYGDIGSNILKYDDSYFKEMIEECDTLNGAPIWRPSNIQDEVHYVDLIVNKNDNREGINLARTVKDMVEGNPIGYILIRTNERYFSKIYENIDDNKQRIFIITENGRIASSNSPLLITGDYYSDPKLLTGINNSIEKGDNSFIYTTDQKYLLVHSKIERADWFIVGLIPYTYLNTEPWRIGIYSIVVGLICFLLSILLSLFISKSISEPLKKMVQTMQLVKEGDLTICIKDQNKDELSEVANHFDDMLNDIRSLLELTKLQEKEKRTAELIALQAQINPHFISNTLNSIKWMASIQGAENIEKLIFSLIQMLNVSMGKEDQVVTMEEELEYLKNYIVIQEFRYYDKFKVKFDIDEETLKLQMARFLLQPILENAIIHGIEPLEGQGLILVKAFIEDDKLKITFTDDGVGFSQQRIDEALCDKLKRKDAFCGIGISNVNDRIKMLYGDSFGLQIQSVPNMFTTVEVSLPIIRES
ncbi:MAG: sensor histidine kinase [Anaerolineaceae bacterium]|nr:MAG: sensor histidine kinase [Anaerolineaceae bacterium]